MRRLSELPRHICVYRRVRIGQGWERQGSNEVPLPGAFDDRNQRLSVFVEDATTPRRLLQDCIDLWVERGSEGQLRKHGSTVEALVDSPPEWRVLRVPLAALLAADLAPGAEVVAEDGHVEMCGDPSRYWDDLIDAAKILSAEACKAPGP